MLQQRSPYELTAPAGASSARDFLQATEFDDALPERLIQNPDGRAFEPVQLGSAADEHTLAGQLAYLLRPEPIGGAEPLIQTGQQRLHAQARARFYQRLAMINNLADIRTFLSDLEARLRALQERIETRLAERQQSYQVLQDRLRAWQERTRRRSAAGVVSTLVGWVFGGEGMLSLPQAVALWNERERLHLTRAALMAALNTLSRFVEEVSSVSGRLMSLAVQARQGHERALRQLADLEAAPLPYAPVTFCIQAHTVAAHLIAQAQVDRLVAEALTQLAQQPEGTHDLEPVVQAVARQEAQRLAAMHDIVRLLEYEARTADPEIDDPLLVAGQGLLRTLVERPTWQLAPQAQPRMEVLQLTPDGQPLFELEGLSSASPGESGDYLGFVQVQMDVALSDLRLMHEGEEAFCAALREQNFFADAELAREWAARVVGAGDAARDGKDATTADPANWGAGEL